MLAAGLLLPSSPGWFNESIIRQDGRKSRVGPFGGCFPLLEGVSVLLCPSLTSYRVIEKATRTQQVNVATLRNPNGMPGAMGKLTNRSHCPITQGRKGWMKRKLWIGVLMRKCPICKQCQVLLIVCLFVWAWHGWIREKHAAVKSCDYKVNYCLIEMLWCDLVTLLCVLCQLVETQWDLSFTDTVIMCWTVK